MHEALQEEAPQEEEDIASNPHDGAKKPSRKYTGKKLHDEDCKMYEIPEIQGMSIVLVGNFNAKIFQPAWFAMHKLIREKEAENAAIDVIAPDITEFTIDWLRVRVTEGTFVMETVQEPYYETMRDLVVSVFHLLEHTPIKMMGLNTIQHFKIHSEEEWQALGHALAPKDQFWSPVLDKPDLRNLTIEGTRQDGEKGSIRVTIAPSQKIIPGIHILINDHFETEDDLGCQKIIDILERSWEAVAQRAATLITHIRNTKP